MIKQTYLTTLLFTSTLLTGCINIEPALSGKAYRDYQNSIRPYIESWGKSDMTTGQRIQDWVSCGGARDGAFSPNIKVLHQERQTDENNNNAAHDRLNDELQRCMIKHGYHYTGRCDSEIMKRKPACGALE